MAKTKNKPDQGKMKGLSKKYLNLKYAKKLIFDPHYIAPTCWALLLFEFLLNFFIIERVNYTEIDWKAYMQEVEGFLNGTLDYKELRGDTGPCVYPAGFLYIYSFFYYLTSNGTNIRLAQYIFLVIYLLQTYLIYEIYKRTCKIPAYAIILSTLSSYRIHSIYVLRLFNDPIAVLLFYYSLNLFLSGKWKTGSLFFSLAVSIKMNILLYAPCLLIAYLTNLSLLQTAVNLFICGFVQLLLAVPFLMTNPWSYVKASFDLGRVFEHKWTVNYRFLSKEVFENKLFHLGLLSLHVFLLLVLYPLIKRYLSSYATLRSTLIDMKKSSLERVKVKAEPVVETEEPLSKEQESFLAGFEQQLKKGNPHKRNVGKPVKKPEPVHEEEEGSYEINFSKISQLFVLPFFITNLIGIACARSLHYQFYSWYYHSLLYLVLSTPYKKMQAFLILGLIEYCWNVYPSTDFSSTLLHILHIVLIYGVYKNMTV